MEPIVNDNALSPNYFKDNYLDNENYLISVNHQAKHLTLPVNTFYNHIFSKY